MIVKEKYVCDSRKKITYATNMELHGNLKKIVTMKDQKCTTI